MVFAYPDETLSLVFDVLPEKPIWTSILGHKKFAWQMYFMLLQVNHLTFEGEAGEMPWKNYPVSITLVPKKSCSQPLP